MALQLAPEDAYLSCKSTPLVAGILIPTNSVVTLDYDIRC